MKKKKTMKKTFLNKAVSGPAAEKTPSVPAQWFYMNDREVTVRDLAASFETKEATEIWEEAGIVEVLLGEKSSMDMEQTAASLEDEEGRAFLENNRICSLFWVTISPGDYKQAEAAMKKIIAKNGGFFCGDTDDFTPLVR